MSFSNTPDCPVEIWHRIFAFACTDGGKTGCSLSQVSKFIRDASDPFRYQTIVLEDLMQTSALTEIMEKGSGSHKTRHLFMGDTSDQEKWRFFKPWCWSDLYQFLPPISASLTTLIIYPRRGFLLSVLPPISLFMLEEIQIYGNYIHGHYCYSTQPEVSPVFPRLLKLLLKITSIPVYSPGNSGPIPLTQPLLAQISLAAPAIRELAIPTDALYDWGHALGTYVHPHRYASPTLKTLFPGIQSVTVYLSSLPAGGVVGERRRAALEAIAMQKLEIRFEVLEVLEFVGRDDDTYIEAKRAWLDMVGGDIDG